jgi:hypothetical protein
MNSVDRVSAVEIMSRLKPEAGSMAPLMVGLASISIAVILIITSLGSAFVFQRRLVSIAEAKALSAIIDGPEIVSPMPLATESISSPDGQTVEVRVCAIWQPPFRFGKLIGFANRDQLICASGLSRLGK